MIPLPCPFRGGSAITHAYFLDTPEPAIVDTGISPSPHSVLEPALAAAGIKLSDVKWILATHGHWDHTGGAHALREMTGGQAQLVLHENDLDLLGRRQAHLDGYFGVRYRYIDDPVLLAEADAVLFENISGEIGADRVIKGGEKISLGGGHAVTTVHTPGHSLGSVTYLLDGPQWAFAGDAVQIYGGGANVPMFVDPVRYRASLNTLINDVRPNRLLLGHSYKGPNGSSYPAQLEGAQLQRALAASLEREQQFEEAARLVVDDGTAAGFARAAESLGFDPSNPVSWPYQLFTSLSSYLPGQR